MLQLPYVVSTLQDDGYVIHHHDEPNGSTTYLLMHVPLALKKEARLIKGDLDLTPPPEPTMFELPSQQDIKDKLEILMGKLKQLRRDYVLAENLVDQAIILRRGRAIKNAIYKLDPNHSEIARG